MTDSRYALYLIPTHSLTSNLFQRIVFTVIMHEKGRFFVHFSEHLLVMSLLQALISYVELVHQHIVSSGAGSLRHVPPRWVARQALWRLAKTSLLFVCPPTHLLLLLAGGLEQPQQCTEQHVDNGVRPEGAHMCPRALESPA